MALQRRQLPIGRVVKNFGGGVHTGSGHLGWALWVSVDGDDATLRMHAAVGRTSRTPGALFLRGACRAHAVVG